ncbi:MAG: oligosaccharide flippase family protein [Thalassotalea sp.]|nr:oligosaccharide flippase family protein [Thalassotalea sp.]
MSAIKQVSWSATSSIGGSLLDIIKIVVFTKFIVPEEFATFAIALVVLGFCQIFSEGGIGNAIVSKKDISPRQVGHIFNFSILISLFLCFLVFLLMPLILKAYPLEKLGPVIYLSVLSLPFASAGRILQALLQKNMKIIVIAKVNLFVKLISLFSGFFALKLGYGLYALPISICTLSLFNLIFCVLLSKKYIQYTKFIHWLEVKPILSFSIYQLGEFFLNFCTRNMDILLITKFLGAEIAGVYSVSKNLLMRVGDVIVSTFSRYFHPVLAKFQDVKLKLVPNYFSYFKLVVLFVCISYFFVATNSALFVEYALGENFTYAQALFPYLCFWLCIRFCTAPVATLWLIKQKPQIGVYWNVIGVFLTYFMIHFTFEYGIEFVIFALASSQFVLLSSSIILAGSLLEARLEVFKTLASYITILFITLNLIFLMFIWLKAHWVMSLFGSITLVFITIVYLYLNRNKYLGNS